LDKCSFALGLKCIGLDAFKKGYAKLIECGCITSINGLLMNFMNATCTAKMTNNYVISPSGTNRTYINQ
jgi:hypothetical protein